MPRRASEARVTFASIAPRANTLGSPDALLKALVPGTAYPRYGRMWRLARYQREGDYVLGRIGFTRTTGVTEHWNDELEDFEVVAQTEGATAPYVIDVHRLQMAFQLRPGIIRPRTFTGAMQALLNEATLRAYPRLGESSRTCVRSAGQTGSKASNG